MKMKKIFPIVLGFFLIFTGCFVLTGCTSDHTHEYSADWSYNEIYHWHECTDKDCNAVKDVAKHTFENGVCTVCDVEKELIVNSDIELTKGSYVLKACFSDEHDFSMPYYAYYEIITLKEENIADYTGRFDGSMGFRTFSNIPYAIEGHDIRLNFSSEQITGHVINETTFVLKFVNSGYNFYNVFEYQADQSIPVAEYTSWGYNNLSTDKLYNLKIEEDATAELKIYKNREDANPTVKTGTIKILGNRFIFETDDIIYMGCIAQVCEDYKDFHLLYFCSYDKNGDGSASSFTLLDEDQTVFQDITFEA